MTAALAAHHIAAAARCCCLAVGAVDPSGSSRTVCDAIFFSLFLPYMLPATALLALLTSASNYISEDLKFGLDTALSMEIRR